jgi:hypothetical protein
MKAKYTSQLNLDLFASVLLGLCFSALALAYFDCLYI